MKILVNLSTLKTGGGLNVALNFLMHVAENRYPNIHFSFIVAKGTPLLRFLEGHECGPYFTVSMNPMFRILQELTNVRGFLATVGPDIIYSYFGYGLFPGSVKQVIGSADSNLYFPEVDFWKDEIGWRRLKRWLVDRYRLFGISRSAGVIFENRLMEQRGRELLRIHRSKFIAPSINRPDLEVEYRMPVDVSKGSIKLLFLCGWQLNKNIMVIPELAKNLLDRGIQVSILLTAPFNSSPCHREFSQRINELAVGEAVHVVGLVEKKALASLYQQVDYVMLLSRLESFSNNIIESWAFNRNLIISDAEWSRSICGDAAIYVQRDDVEVIAREIERYEHDSSLKQAMVVNGQRALAKYPSIDSKIRQEIDFLREVYESF